MNATRELVLSEIWHHQWLTGDLVTAAGEPVRVVYRGVWTHGLGPDFSGAYLEVGGRLVHGAVEIHARTSDWAAHGHHLDRAYDAVVLHAVYNHEPGVVTRRHDGRIVPVLELSRFLPAPIEQFAPAAGLLPLGAIGFAHCAPGVAAADPSAVYAIWEQAGDARMTGKVTRVAGQLAVDPPAQVLYGLLLDALGYSRNSAGMRQIAERLPWDHLDVRLTGHAPGERWRRAAGLLTGVAGFLPLSPSDADIASVDSDQQAALETSWRTHGGAWADLALPPSAWSLARVRPAAHPLRRLLALATIVSRLEVGLLEDFTALARSGRYRPVREHLARDNPYLGQAHAHEIVVNAIVPFMLAYGDAAGDEPLVEAAGAVWRAAPAGRGNAVVQKMAEQVCGPHPIRIASARAEQGLLHLHHTGCSAMRCYECPIARLALTHPAGGVDMAVPPEKREASACG